MPSESTPTDNPIKITRPRTAAEYAAYYALRWEVLRKPHFKDPGSEKDAIEESAHHVMAVDEDGRTVGVGRIHLREDGIAQIRYLAVHPEYEGKGIGRRIMEELEGLICSAQGSSEIELNARDTAVPFYEKCGYWSIRPGHKLWGVIPHTVMGKCIVCEV